MNRLPEAVHCFTQQDLVLEIDVETLVEEGLPVTGADLAYGYLWHFVGAASVVDYSSIVLAGGTDDPLIAELALLLRDELEQVEQLVRQWLADALNVHDPRESKRLWLYLQLKALRRVGMTREARWRGFANIFIDFGYPKHIARLGGAAVVHAHSGGATRRMEAEWEKYLLEEHELLTSAPWGRLHGNEHGPQPGSR